MYQYPKIETILIEKRDAIYKYSLPAGTKKVTFSARNGREFRLSFEKDCFDQNDPLSQGNFISIGKGQIREFTDLSLSEGLDIFISCDIPGEVIEISRWQ